MNLFSLQATSATLIKSNSSNYNFKLDKNKLKNDVDNLKKEGKIKDLLSVSENLQGNITELNTNEGVKRFSNYSTDVFFTKDFPTEAVSEGNYEINSVKFTQEELTDLRRVMQATVNSIGVGIGKNINIDYINYAQMAIAENSVNQYAKENFNEAQQKVIAKAINSYNSALEKMQRDFLNNDTFVQNDYGELSDYYGLSKVLTQEDANALNQLKNELGKVTGKKYPLSKAGDATGIVQIATNDALIENIKDIFSKLDLTDEAAVNSALEKYQELMKPAYLASGTEKKDINKRLNSDTSILQNMLKSISSVQRYTQINYSI